MAITSTTRTRQGETVVIEVTSDLVGTVYFHWWLDGAYVGQTPAGRMEFQVPVDEQARVTVQDTLDANYDPLGPLGLRVPPGRMTAAWYQSLDPDTAYYQVWMWEETAVPVVDYQLVGTVPHDPARWLYTYLSPRVQGFRFNFKIFPVDKYGNVGAEMEQVGPSLSIAQPLAPNWTYVWEFAGAGTRKVTYAAAV